MIQLVDLEIGWLKLTQIPLCSRENLRKELAIPGLTGQAQGQQQPGPFREPSRWWVQQRQGTWDGRNPGIPREFHQF